MKNQGNLCYEDGNLRKSYCLAESRQGRKIYEDNNFFILNELHVEHNGFASS